MSESQGNAGLGRDALGLLLIVIGVFFGAFTVMANIQPKEHPNETTAAFMALVGAVGSIAAMFLALGILFVGVRLWIAGISGRIGRDLLGVLITTITLATLMGAIYSGLGGSVGALLGGRVSAFLTPFVGIPYGLCVVLLPAWFLWLRPRALVAWDEAELAAPTAGPMAGQLTGLPAGSATGQGASRDSNRPLGQAFGTAAGSGRIKTTDASSVSAAEAAALLPPTPAARPIPATAARGPATPAIQSAPRTAVPADTNAPRPSSLPRNNAPSPYPVDVRVHGGIPEGARPLETPNARTVQQSPPHAPTVQPGHIHSPSAPQQSAGANLADAERVHEPRGELKPVVDSSPVRERARGEVGAPASGAAARAEVPGLGQPLAAPSQAPTFDVSSEDERETETDLAFADEIEEPIEAEQPSAPPAQLAADVKPFSATPPAPSWEQPGLFEEPVDAYGTPLSLVEELRKSNGETATRLEGEVPAAQIVEGATPDIDSKLESTEPKFEITSGVRGLFDEPADAAAERAELEDDEESDGDALDVDDAQDADAEADSDSDDAADEPDDDTLDDDEEEAEVEVRRVVVDDETLAADTDIDDVADDVVLQPQAPPAPQVAAAAAAPSPKPKSARAPVVDDLVYRAGCLFLERQRVAVSMLQRDFGLDFKAATEVLDQLQKAGLIGPYLGGQRRDILITREQWDELVGVS